MNRKTIITGALTLGFMLNSFKTVDAAMISETAKSDLNQNCKITHGQFVKSDSVNIKHNISKNGSRVDFTGTVGSSLDPLPWVEGNMVDKDGRPIPVGSNTLITKDEKKSNISVCQFSVNAKDIKNGDIITTSFFAKDEINVPPAVEKNYIFEKDNNGKITSVNEVKVDTSYQVSKGSKTITFSGSQEVLKMAKGQELNISTVPWVDLRDGDSGQYLTVGEVRGKVHESKHTFNCKIKNNELKVGDTFVSIPFYSKNAGSTPYRIDHYVIHKDEKGMVTVKELTKKDYVTHFENLNK